MNNRKIHQIVGPEIDHVQYEDRVKGCDRTFVDDHKAFRVDRKRDRDDRKDRLTARENKASHNESVFGI